MPPNHFESEVESFLEGSHGDRTHHKQRADHHTVTPLCGTLLFQPLSYRLFEAKRYIENVGISVKTWCVAASTA